MEIKSKTYINNNKIKLYVIYVIFLCFFCGSLWSAVSVADVSIYKESHQYYLRSESKYALIQYVLPRNNPAASENEKGINFARLRMYKRALDAFEKALKFNRFDYKVLNNIGTIYIKLDQYDKSEKSFDLAMEQMRNKSIMMNNRSILLALNGTLKEAVLQLKKAVILSHDPKLVENNIRLIKKQIKKMDSESAEETTNDEESNETESEDAIEGEESDSAEEITDDDELDNTGSEEEVDSEESGSDEEITDGEESSYVESEDVVEGEETGDADSEVIDGEESGDADSEEAVEGEETGEAEHGEEFVEVFSQAEEEDSADGEEPSEVIHTLSTELSSLIENYNINGNEEESSQKDELKFSQDLNMNYNVEYPKGQRLESNLTTRYENYSEESKIDITTFNIKASKGRNTFTIWDIYPRLSDFTLDTSLQGILYEHISPGHDIIITGGRNQRNIDESQYGRYTYGGRYVRKFNRKFRFGGNVVDVEDKISSILSTESVVPIENSLRSVDFRWRPDVNWRVDTEYAWSSYDMDTKDLESGVKGTALKTDVRYQKKKFLGRYSYARIGPEFHTEYGSAIADRIIHESRMMYTFSPKLDISGSFRWYKNNLDKELAFTSLVQSPGGVINIKPFADSE
ncbi:hypothetical protein KAJ27_25060 [bacterium]|nr:hypothetical protein [bacterium]